MKKIHPNGKSRNNTDKEGNLITKIYPPKKENNVDKRRREGKEQSSFLSRPDMSRTTSPVLAAGAPSLRVNCCFLEHEGGGGRARVLAAVSYCSVCLSLAS